MEQFTEEKFQHDNKKAEAVKKYLSHFQVEKRKDILVSGGAGVLAYVVGGRYVPQVGFRLGFAMAGYFTG